MREGAQLTRNNVSAYAALKAGMARVLQTAGDTGDKLREKTLLKFRSDESGHGNHHIYDDVAYQTIEGFGGALTETSAVTIAKQSGQGSWTRISIRSMESAVRCAAPLFRAAIPRSAITPM